MPRIRSHLGEILNEEFLKPLALSAGRLALDIDVPPNWISDLVRERRGMTADTALRLGRRFGTSPQFWLNLQMAYDLSRAWNETDLSRVRGPEHLRPARGG